MPPFYTFIPYMVLFFMIGAIRMPYYATHLLVGLICSLPFYHLDKKDRLRTIIAGMFAGVLPDIDGFLQFIPHPESINIFVRHRGFWHWWGLPVLFVIFSIIYVYYKSVTNTYRSYDIDNSLTFAAISCAWFSHLFLDFGFTSYSVPAFIFNIPEFYIFAVDQFAALLLSAILGYLLWLRNDTFV